MTYHDKVSTHNKRMMIVISCVAVALFMTTGILLTIGTISVQGAANNAPDAPDVVECDGGSWNCEDVEDPLFRLKNMTDRSLRYKSDGTPCVVFGQDGLYYACHNEGTNLWDGAGVPIDSSPLVGEYAALAFNDADLPFISYYDGANGSLKLAYHNGTAWVIDTIVDKNTTCTWGGVYAPQTGETLAGESSPPDSWLEALISGNFWGDKILEPVQENLPGMLAPAVAEVDGVGRYTSIAVDSDNRIHISFSDWNGLNQNSLKYYYWDTGATRECRVIDDNGSDYDDQDFLWTSIATDGNIVHISYFFDKYDQLRYAGNKNGDQFEITEVERRRDSGDPGTGGFTSIAVDDDGVTHISYLQWEGNKWVPTNGDLMVAENVNTGGNCGWDYSGGTGELEGNWNCTTVDNNPNVGGYTSIAFDKKPADDDEYIISYYDFANRNLKSNRSGHGADTLFSTGNVGLYTSVDTHYHSGYNTKKFAIAFLDETEGELIVAQKVGGAGWVKLGAKGYVAKYGDVGMYSSLAIRQADDIPFISYYNYYNKTDGFLKYAFGTMLVTPPPPLYFWESAAVTDNLYAGTFSSIGIGGPNSPVFRLGDSSDSEPVIAFYSTYDLEEDEATEDLIYAYRDKFTLDWVFDEVDTTGDVGQHVDMALESTGIPHISYYDASRGALLYATRNDPNTAWITDTFDNNGDVGLFTSIDMSPNDRPYIAYYDYTNARIKFKYQTPLGGWPSASVVATGVGFFDDDGVDPIEADLSMAYEDVPSPGQDLIHISYFDQIYNVPDPDSPLGDLKYVRGTVDPSTGAVTWGTPVTLDSSVAVVGLYNDLVVNNSTGELNVCYYDGTNGNLKVRKWDSNWKTPLVIDSEGDTGLYCSTALESTGMVTVSYYDKSRGSLRFAHNPVESSGSYFFYIPIVIK